MLLVQQNDTLTSPCYFSVDGVRSDIFVRVEEKALNHRFK